jgi:broad specificity phosphatase PhoE
VDAGLADWNLGAWAGRSLAELASDNPDGVRAWTSDPDFAGHGGETLTEVIERVGGWLDQPSTEANPSANQTPTGRPDRLIAVTHPAVIRSAVVHALQAPPHSFWRIDVAPLAVVELRGAAGRWSLYPQPF